MKKPIMASAVTIFFLSLAACHLSPQATNAAAERLFVMALNAVFRVASSDLLPAPPVRTRAKCNLPRKGVQQPEICSNAQPDPIVVKARRESPAVVF